MALLAGFRGKAGDLSNRLFCAGLCRTCEVFGAAALVVGSLQCVSDRQFQHLSVSAEQWLPLLEVGVTPLSRSYTCECILAHCLYASFSV